MQCTSIGYTLMLNPNVYNVKNSWNLISKSAVKNTCVSSRSTQCQHRSSPSDVSWFHSLWKWPLFCLFLGRLACGIIARSAGLFQNPKQICACDGVTLWEERDRPIAGKGRSKETPAANLWPSHTNADGHLRGKIILKIKNHNAFRDKRFIAELLQKNTFSD